jgi:hypothetical protein
MPHVPDAGQRTVRHSVIGRQLHPALLDHAHDHAARPIEARIEGSAALVVPAVLFHVDPPIDGVAHVDAEGRPGIRASVLRSHQAGDFEITEFPEAQFLDCPFIEKRLINATAQRAGERARKTPLDLHAEESLVIVERFILEC